MFDGITVRFDHTKHLIFNILFFKNPQLKKQYIFDEKHRKENNVWLKTKII